MLKRGEPRQCMKCYGAGHVLTEDERLELHFDHGVGVLPGAGESFRNSVENAVASFEQAVSGVPARPAIKVSKQARELEKLLAEDQERKERYGGMREQWK